MKLKYKVILFVICLIGLLTLQYKYIMPAVYDVVSSDLFLEGDEDNAIPDAMSDEMLNYAYSQCNNYVANDLDSEISVYFTDKPINAWDLGGNQYVINADIDLTPPNAPSFTRRYACRIQYTHDSADLSEVTNSDNWSVNGLSGLDDL